jgi:homospermidine synthase
MIDFNKRILFVGYGAVAQCTLPILLRHLRVPLTNITVLDCEDRSGALEPWIAQGLTWINEKITPDNLVEVLGQFLDEGDLLIDLAWNIDCCELLSWCHERGVLYLNTSVEVWDPYVGGDETHPTQRTLYWRHLAIRRLVATWTKPGPTAVIEHGANPGLISHFTKQALLDIADRACADGKLEGADREEIPQLAADRNFPQLAMRLGVKVIHCSERDTQISDQPKRVDEFVNTWSVEGFREEGTTTAEMGWGTHEKTLPRHAFEHADGPKNQICLAHMGINTWVRSWVPYSNIRGMVVRHGEAFTISDRLTVWEGDRAVYRPTVHYAYCPCDAAIASINELRGYDYQLPPTVRIMTDEIISGSDALGALVMGHMYHSWWTGTILSIEESRRLVPHQNATTMQVAIAVVAAVMWAIEHPDRGVVVPDQLPHDFVLGVARPYLGTVLSIPSDWTPLKYVRSYFGRHDPPHVDWSDPWQFKNFLVGDRD